ncbi:histone H1-like repetitive region-containing protein [Geomonas silvestris]|nr:histone H1-like repetitive region-containing protein [Geomonas silvestris]
MSTLLKKYPDTPLKDMAIFWLARANYKAGNQRDAGKYMAQFLRDYPESPLKATVEEGLMTLAERYQKNELTDEGAAKAPAAELAAKAAADKAAAEKAVAERVAAEKAAAEKAAAEKAAVEKLAAQRAAAEKVAAEQAAAERAAAEKIAAEKIAAERVAAERAAAEKAAAEKAAAEKAAAEKAAAEKAAAEKAAAEKAAAEKAAAEKAAAEKAAAEKAAAEKAAAEKAAAAKKAAAERAAAERAAEKTAAQKAAAERAAAEKAAAERAAAAKAEKASVSGDLRDKAIAAYKDVIDRYPGTAAASSATAKLHQMGIEYPTQQRPVNIAPQGEITQVYNLEVAQYADVDIQLGPAAETEEAGKRFVIPFDIVNAGNGNDSFTLESGFPPEFDFHFAPAKNPETAIANTPVLGVGAKYRVLAVGSLPRGNIDGQRNVYPIKVISNYSNDTSQSKEIALVSSAPLLRAVVKTDKAKLLPGERIAYRISLLNVGTAAARGVTVRLNYPPQYEPVGELPPGFKQETKASLVLDGIRLRSGESNDFNVTFQLKDEALAEQELFLRADVINNDLDKKESFVSSTSVVQRVSGVAARTTAEKLVVIPGQVVAIPLIVTNTGNLRELFTIKANVPSSASYSFFDDLNRDGKRQFNEPIINHVGPLSPKEEAYVVMEISTPASAHDGAIAPVSVVFESENVAEKTAGVHLQLTYSRPILELGMAGKGGRLKPGEVSSLELNCVNRGSNMAKQVTLQSIIPSQLELVAADPAFTKSDNGVYSWRFEELGAGEKRSIKVSYRVKPGIAVGTSMQMKNLLNYQDQIGNRY